MRAWERARYKQKMPLCALSSLPPIVVERWCGLKDYVALFPVTLVPAKPKEDLVGEELPLKFLVDEDRNRLILSHRDEDDC